MISKNLLFPFVNLILFEHFRYDNGFKLAWIESIGIKNNNISILSLPICFTVYKWKKEKKIIWILSVNCVVYFLFSGFRSSPVMWISNFEISSSIQHFQILSTNWLAINDRKMKKKTFSFFIIAFCLKFYIL